MLSVAVCGNINKVIVLICGSRAVPQTSRLFLVLISQQSLCALLCWAKLLPSNCPIALTFCTVNWWGVVEDFDFFLWWKYSVYKQWFRRDIDFWFSDCLNFFAWSEITKLKAQCIRNSVRKSCSVIYSVLGLKKNQPISEWSSHQVHFKWNLWKA